MRWRLKQTSGRHLLVYLLAGLCLLAAVAAAHAAHEPEPVLDVVGGEVEVTPPALVPWDTEPGQQQDAAAGQQQQQQSQPGNAASGTDSSAAAPSPPPSPAPHMATILPLMPMVLPGCPFDSILDSNKAWDFPKNWASMALEQQALHPINLLLMNMVGVPSTDLLSMVNPCLHSWGVVKGSVTKIVKDYKVGNSMTMKTVVLVFRTKKHVWVVFRATDDDWAADFDCMYTSDLRKKLNVPTPPLGAPKLQLHRGFWSAYSAVDKQLMQEVNKQLKLVKTNNPFQKPQVWLAGHSLGGALSSIGAFRMVFDPKFAGEVAGVVTFGSPRVGNEVWQTLYHEKLMDKTLRWNNHRDLFAALPAKGQFCLSSSPLKTVFSFRHVGRAVLLCPSTAQPGLQEFKFFPKGTETSCKTGETLIIGTHLLGHYFDGWRRAYAAMKGLAAATLLSGGPHVRSVMCAQCALAVKPYPLPDNKAARNDGVVSCVDNRSCNDKELFSVVSWAGLFPTAFFRADAVCDGATALCQVPSAALTQVQNKLMEIAPNITAAVGAFASKAFANNPVAMFFQGMGGINMTSFMAAYSGNATAGAGGLGGIGQQGSKAGTGTGGAGTGEQEQEAEAEEEGEDSKGEEGVHAAAFTGASVSGFSGDELVVEPSMDGDILLVTPEGQDSSSSSSSNSTQQQPAAAGAAAGAGGNHTAAADDAQRPASSKHSHSKQHHAAKAKAKAAAGSVKGGGGGGGGGTDTQATIMSDPEQGKGKSPAAAAAADGDAGDEEEEEDEQQQQQQPGGAKPAGSRVLGMMGGLVAGLWNHLQPRAQ